MKEEPSKGGKGKTMPMLSGEAKMSCEVVVGCSHQGVAKSSIRKAIRGKAPAVGNQRDWVD